MKNKSNMILVYEEIAYGNIAFYRNIYEVIKGRNISGKVPSFFYKHPVFRIGSSIIFKRDNLSIDAHHDVKTDNLMMVSEVLKLILSNSGIKQNILVSEISRYDIEDIVGEDIDFHEVINLLMKLSLSFYAERNSSSFFVFESVSFDGDSYFKFIFSNGVASLFALDELVRYDKKQNLFNGLKEENISEETKTEIYNAINLVLSYIRDDFTVDIDYLRDKVKPQILSHLSHVILHKKIKDKKSNLSKIINRMGISFNYDNSYFGVKSGFIERDMDYVSLSDIKEGRVQGEYVNFETLEFTEKIKKKAENYGLSEEEARTAFSLFKEFYIKNRKTCKQKYFLTTWGKFLSSEIVDKDRPNHGKPENIVFNEEMEKQLKMLGISEEEGREEFTSFRSYWIARKEKHQNWVTKWSSWLSNYKKYKGKHSVHGVKKELSQQGKSEDFLQKGVSEGIKKYLLNKKIPTMKVVRGEISIKGIGVKKSTNKKDILLYFLDPEKQKNAEEKWMAANNPTTINSNNSKLIEAKIV